MTSTLLAERRPVRVWGLPLLPVTFDETLAIIDDMIRSRQPGFLITANLHYAMLTAEDNRLPTLNEQAAFIVADGMPLVWASRWRKARLPERVTGSDLVPRLCERAAERGYRIFFLGGAPGVADEAARRLKERLPKLEVAGIEVPPFRALSAEENAALVARIRATNPDILIVAFGQPKGELWIRDNLEALGTSVCIQAGATIDFLAGRVSRAPGWIQRSGFEWLYRFSREPLRLGGRYFRNWLFIGRKLLQDALGLMRRKELG